MEDMIYMTKNIVNLDDIFECFSKKGYTVYKQTDQIVVMYDLEYNGKKYENYIRISFVNGIKEFEEELQDEIASLGEEFQSFFHIAFFNDRSEGLLERLYTILGCYGGYLDIDLGFYTAETLRDCEFLKVR
jgi:predicted metal-dependent phosphoesterase TrpH